MPTAETVDDIRRDGVSGSRYRRTVMGSAAESIIHNPHRMILSKTVVPQHRAVLAMSVVRAGTDIHTRLLNVLFSNDRRIGRPVGNVAKTDSIAEHADQPPPAASWSL